jgi:hypothetical protein
MAQGGESRVCSTWLPSDAGSSRRVGRCRGNGRAITWRERQKILQVLVHKVIIWSDRSVKLAGCLDGSQGAQSAVVAQADKEWSQELEQPLGMVLGPLHRTWMV